MPRLDCARAHHLRLPRRATGLDATAVPTTSSASRRRRLGGGRLRSDARSICADGDLLRPLSRLQGLAHRRARRSRALLADGHEEARAAPTSPSSTRCCVTHEAVRKSRQAAARAARTHARVYVTGCGAEPRTATRSPACPRTSRVVATPSEETPAFVAGDVGAIGCVQADARLDRVRAFVKVQDGCSFSCNFCVIPLVRGASRSRRAEAVLAEVARRVDAGAPRGRPDRDQPRLLPRPRGRLRPAAPRPRGRRDRRGSTRLRLSSIEVNHVDDELVAALRETPTVSRHLHVPLQSGDDGVLRAMARRYTAGDVPAPPRAAREDFNLTTRRDRRLPGRGRARVRADARASSSAAGITKVHVFPYSPRPGTATAAHDPVPPAGEEGAQRAAARRLARGVPARAGARRSAREDVVLVDRPGRGYGDDYSPWLVDAPRRRARARPRRGRLGGGDPRCLTTASSAGSSARATTSRQRTEGFVAISDIDPTRRHAPARHPRAARRDASARSASSRRTRRSGCSTSSPRRRATRGSRTTASSSTSARAAGRRSSTCTGTSSAARMRGLPA